MDFLSGWLKSVVLVILIATFVDLLLPNQSMQRYVKTVISMFLLLTLLQPLLSLLRSDAALDERLAAALSPDLAAVSGGEMDSLTAIRQRANALQARQFEQTSALVENQVEELMKRKIEQSADVDVRNVQVVTAPDETGQPVIRKVTLQVAEGRPAEIPNQARAKPVAAMETVKPIEPVVPVADIRISDGSAATAARSVPQSASFGPDKEPLSPALLQTKTQIIRMLEQDWQLTQEQIELTLEPAPGR